jgi:hypothetical protein
MKSKFKNLKEVEAHFWYYWESAQWVRFYGGNFIILEQSCGRHWILSNPCCWKLNKNSNFKFSWASTHLCQQHRPH